ncbi:unnamed protein product [Acanthosepion pharaonis]|uniref:Uncharacterized protein n=1 Tax=Acanthosepion pharaonis TaxID=158019 RepID=A0A812B5N4_ACAPH|nr:unnamed protein product [Sepia pharaonis]
MSFLFGANHFVNVFAKLYSLRYILDSPPFSPSLNHFGTSSSTSSSFSLPLSLSRTSSLMSTRNLSPVCHSPPLVSILALNCIYSSRLPLSFFLSFFLSFSFSLVPNPLPLCSPLLSLSLFLSLWYLLPLSLVSVLFLSSDAHCSPSLVFHLSRPTSLYSLKSYLWCLFALSLSLSLG